MISHSLRQFEIFIEVVLQRSFTRAAEKLAISKAAVSTAIKALEDELQIPLFFRTTRQIQLSQEGEQLFEQCQSLINELDNTRQMLTNFHQEPLGLLRISSNSFIVQNHLKPIVFQYLRKFTKVKIDILAEERMPDMIAEKIDLVFGINWPAPDDVLAKKIGQTRYVLCASPEYLAQYGTPEKIGDLKEHLYIPHTGRQEKNLIIGLKQPLTARPSIKIRLNNAEIMKQFALENQGIIQLHDYMIQDELASGKLVEVLKDEVYSEKPLYVYYHRFRYVQPKVRQFLKLIDENIH
jgi:DNA-binding transcriptional LysR family regulator